MTSPARRLAARLPAPARRLARRLLGRPLDRPDRRAEDRPTRLARLAGVQALPHPSHRLPLRVAGALSPRLTAALEPECRLRPAADLHLEPEAVDLLLLEYHAGAVPGQEPAEVARLVAAARQAGVPSVVWATASTGLAWPDDDQLAAADTWFADDPQTATAWSRSAGRAVHPLPPAAQPLLHSMALAGSSQRRSLAAAVLVPDPGVDLSPFAHLPGKHVDLWAFDAPAPTAGLPPEPGAAPGSTESAVPMSDREVQRIDFWREHAVTGLPLDGTRPELGRYRVAAVPGAPPSPWTLVETSMAGTPLVLSAEAAATLPADLRAVHTLALDGPGMRFDTAARLWQAELGDREGLAAARAALAGHTMRQRIERIAAEAGLSTTPSDRTVSVVVPTNRPHELDNVAANVLRQHEHDQGTVQLVLVLHGLDLDPAAVRERFVSAGLSSVEVVTADSSLTLGACMNLGVDAADGRYIAKVDDDNYYGRHYLTDLVNAFAYSGAGIVGKWAHYVWLRSSGAVILRNPTAQFRFERLVQGGAMVFDAAVARELRFGDLPRAVDTDILNRAAQAGVRTFSADRFNFVSIRGVDRHAHTWPIADTALMNRAGDLAFFGDPRPHVEV